MDEGDTCESTAGAKGVRMTRPRREAMTPPNLQTIVDECAPWPIRWQDLTPESNARFVNSTVSAPASEGYPKTIQLGPLTVRVHEIPDMDSDRVILMQGSRIVGEFTGVGKPEPDAEGMA